MKIGKDMINPHSRIFCEAVLVDITNRIHVRFQGVKSVSHDRFQNETHLTNRSEVLLDNYSCRFSRFLYYNEISKGPPLYVAINLIQPTPQL